MPLGSMARRVVAAIALVALIFQAALVGAQLSIAIATRANAEATFLPGIICTDHGAESLPEQAPVDSSESCALCLACLTFAAAQFAILPPTGFSVRIAATGPIQFFSTGDFLILRHSAPPRSRGPPSAV
jgi:hypothetical protein